MLIFSIFNIIIYLNKYKYYEIFYFIITNSKMQNHVIQMVNREFIFYLFKFKEKKK